jgi:uncharacterized protein
MPTYRTPDVYIEEISTFPPSVAEVETAIPAFIGYTEKARKIVANDLLNRPTKIYSFAEYQQYYGEPEAPEIAVTLIASGSTFSAEVKPKAPTHLLYYAVKMFFDNGGGKCYIVSVGDYVDPMNVDKLTAGLDAVALEDEPTLLVCPDALKLGGEGIGYNTIAQAMLAQCGTLKDRFAILDLFDGSAKQDAAALQANRARVGNNNLKYGALYYPDLRSSFNHYVKPDESNVMVTGVPKNQSAAAAAAKVAAAAETATATAAADAAKADATAAADAAAAPAAKAAAAKLAADTAKAAADAAKAAKLAADAVTAESAEQIPLANLGDPTNKKDRWNTAAYNAVKTALLDHFIVVPPSGAVAGVYAAVDSSRGVWKAPANAARLRRQGHFGLGCAHIGGQRQRMALCAGAALF